ncbi:MAG TPA: ribonuclease HIII [Methylomirabilota bacterium]|nr:ribonuclease HIII [Methylomirabilota bacterium]
MTQPLTSYTGKLTPEQGKELQAVLRGQGYELGELPYAVFTASNDKTKIVFYESNKLVVQGKGTPEFIEFVLEPLILKEARRGYETVLNPELLAPRIGVDESGKGDFFGPLCVAGVYVNQQVMERWQEAGVKDSKAIGSDRRIAEIADIIKNTPGCVWTTVPIGPEAYNRLYAKLRTVNSMLAWGHARVIENLMAQRHRMDPPPVRAISDQFAASKDVIAKALMSLGREIELVQRHKAEEDLAVAAASILARDEFVRRLSALGKSYDTVFPKGASAQVDAVAKEFVEKHGAAELAKVSKTHFRTALRAQGLPEPPKTEWRKKT